MDAYDGRQVIFFRLHKRMQQISHFARQGFRCVMGTAGERYVALVMAWLIDSTLLRTWRRAGSHDSTGRLREEHNVCVWAVGGQAINMQNLVLCWYLLIVVILTRVLGMEDVRACALEGLWPKPVRTGPSSMQGLTLLHACQRPATVHKAALYYGLWVISNPLGTFSGLSW